jgi:tRNA(Arg) A34 adenosine deaminase TadA
LSSQQLAEQIAFDIRSLLGDENPFAFLQADSVIYYSTPTSHRSSVVSLIQAVYDHHPAQARRVLRSRIFSTETPTEACLGMVKVAAKRLTAPISPASSSLSEPTSMPFVRLIPLEPPALLRLDQLNPEAQRLLNEKKFMSAARLLSQEIPKQAKLYRSDRAVAAVLVSPQEKVLAIAVNSNAQNRTRHAEINLIQGYLNEVGEKIPAGSRIYVTLKCCKMCAAAIWQASENPFSLRIFYGQDDPGPCARLTVFTPHSFERKRVSSSAAELAAEVESINN